MTIAPGIHQVICGLFRQPGVQEGIGLVFTAAAIFHHGIAADPGGKAFIRIPLHRSRVPFGLQTNRGFIPGPGQGNFTRCHGLCQRRTILPIEADILVHFAQEVRGRFKLVVGGLGPIRHPSRQEGQRIGVIHIIPDRNLALKLRIGEGLQGLNL